MKIGGKVFVIIPIFEPYRKLYGHWVVISLKLEVIADPPFLSVQVKPTLSLTMNIRCMLHQVCSCPIVKMFLMAFSVLLKAYHPMSASAFFDPTPINIHI